MIILPYKGDAFGVINIIRKVLTGKEFKNKGKKAKRFMEDFGSEEVSDRVLIFNTQYRYILNVNTPSPPPILTS